MKVTAERIADKLAVLKPLPATVHRLLVVVNNADASAESVARAIGQDAALTANVLRAANSAFYGHLRQVASLSEAAMRLGTNWIKQVALSSVVYSSVRNSAPGYGQTADDSWRHSAAVAVTCDNLCRLLGIPPSAAMYTAALVHDMGKLALDELVSERYGAIQQRIIDDQLSFVEAERAVLGFDHAEVGALLAERWRFPEQLAQAVRWHHEPDRSPKVDVAIDLVHTADNLCMMNGVGMGFDGMLYRPSAAAAQRLGLTDAISDQAVCRLLDDLEQLDAALNGVVETVSLGR